MRYNPSMETENIITQLETYHGGFFTRDRGPLTRISDNDSWKVFEEPVIVWFRNASITEESIDTILHLLSRVHEVEEVCITASDVDGSCLNRIKDSFPKARISRNN